MATTTSESVKRSDIARAVSERLGGKVSETQVSEIIELTFNEIAQQLYKGEVVKLSGWGIFERVRRGARQARNPRTGEAVRVKAKNVLKFRPGTRLDAAASGTSKPERTPFEVSPAERRAAARRSASSSTRNRVTAVNSPTDKTPAAKKTAARKPVPTKTPAKRTAAKSTTTRSTSTPSTRQSRTPAAKKAPVKKTTGRAATSTTATKKRVSAKRTPAPKTQ